MYHSRISDFAPHSPVIPSAMPLMHQHYSRGLIEANIDAIVITDTTGIISDVNQQMVNITGCTTSELIGSNWFELSDDPVSASLAFAHALTEERVWNVELIVKSRKGTKTAITYSASPIYDRAAKLVGVCATLHDTTSALQYMQRVAVILFWSAAAFTLIMASLPLKFESSDKILHMIAFAVLPLLGTFAYPALRLSVLLLGLSAFGMLIELIQFFPALSRTADWRDLAADILTTAAVVGAIYIFRRLRKRSQLTRIETSKIFLIT